ncbi:MAG TPA: sn-glycerol-3-phosphate import ATP-binding protein UgpC [Azospirillaceae bacterium]|nr:sn-glycerol-3-phosphate import ATP-binding protein UgpC [Azospirillaceae bacterium]
MAGIEIRSVRKAYSPQTLVIKGIDCHVADGELLVMLGPSGCGKSTLLRMVAGLESITDGEIAIGGRVVNNLEPKDRNIAMVFQNYALYPHMSVYDNMAYGLKIRGLSKAEIDTAVKQAAQILELGPYLERKPRQLSGGQRQRVAMGRAIVRQPDVFLFDEPLSNLDAKLRNQMRVEIKKLQTQLGVTSLYVTHDQVEAMTLADRIMVMNGGVAEQIGTPMEVYQRPASTFVAGFIGSPPMNLLPAAVSADGRSIRIKDSVSLPLAEGVANGHAGRPVTLGIRPEHVMTVGSDAAMSLELTVELVEALGADTVVHGRIAGTDEMMLARLPGISQLRMGDRIAVAPVPGELHLFDKDTGRRIAA